jgi:protein TonB
MYYLSLIIIFLTVNTFSQSDTIKNQFDNLGCVLEEDARFDGDENEYKDWIKTNMVYPQEAVDLGISGSCFTKFLVSIDGCITEVVILKGVLDCPLCDSEVVHLLQAMPRWIPAKRGGKAIETWCQTTINFYFE